MGISCRHDNIMVFKAQAVAERKLRCHACMYSHCLKACASCMAPKTRRRSRKNSIRKTGRRSCKNSNRETGRRSRENSGIECFQNAFRMVSECFQFAFRMLPERFPECLQTSVLISVQTSRLLQHCFQIAVRMLSRFGSLLFRRPSGSSPGSCLLTSTCFLSTAYSNPRLAPRLDLVESLVHVSFQQFFRILAWLLA